MIDKFVAFCHKELLKTEAPLKYVTNRFVTGSHLKKYNLCYTPSFWRLPDTDEHYRSFYLNFPEKDPSLFMDKLLFPIYNWKGIFSGLVVRSYKGEKYYRLWKYNNDIPYNHLYGFYENLEYIEKRRTLFIFESCFDLFASDIYVPNSISVLTSRISTYQLAFLKRYVDKVFICLNNDFNSEYNAGLESSLVARNICRNLGLNGVIVSLPDGINDYSEFRAKNGDLESFFSNYQRARK